MKKFKTFENFVNESMKETSISKADLAKILKDLKVETVTMSKDHYHTVTYKDYNGKRVLGIRGGSYGPMTVTSAHNERDKEISKKVADALNNLSISSEDFDNLIITPAVKKTFDDFNFKGTNLFTFMIPTGNDNYKLIKFIWSDYPTNVGSRDRDPGYRTNWYTMQAKDVKIKTLTPIRIASKKYGLS